MMRDAFVFGFKAVGVLLAAVVALAGMVVLWALPYALITLIVLGVLRWQGVL